MHTLLRRGARDMIRLEFKVEEEDFLRELAASTLDVALKMALTMEQVGWEVVSFLRSIGHGLTTPARPGEPNRSSHPGQWADITSNLANSYRFELYAGGELIRWVPEWRPVPKGSRGAAQPVSVQGSMPAKINFPLELRFLNGMEYAAALEARDGYWVLREITGAGGPVARAVRKVMNRIAPDARLEGI